MPLTVLVVGAGIAGLTTAMALKQKGFDVTVLERTPDIQNVGGPMSIRPAAIRLLRSLGLSESLEENCERAISTMNMKRYSTGETLYEMDLSSLSTNEFGDESLGFARQALQNMLFEEVLRRKIEVKFGVKVVGVDDDNEKPAVRLQDGGVLRADLVVGADGIGSKIRESILPPDPNRVNSVLSAWILKIPLLAIQSDPELSTYLTKAYYWLGPGRMAIATRMEKVEIFDLHFYIDKELGEPGEWEKRGNVDDVMEHFNDFDPVLFKFKNLASSKDCYIWRISGLSPLPSWISKGGRIVIIGDAAHAMVPYAAQGASQGIEDGVVLAECLSRANYGVNGNLSKVLQTFEAVRKPRAEAIARYGLSNLKRNHFPDGPLQEARDNRMKSWRENALKAPKWNGIQILEPPEPGSPQVDAYMLGYDALAHVNNVLDQELAK